MVISPRPFGALLGDAMSALTRVWKPLLSTALYVFIPLALLTLGVFSYTGGLEFLELVMGDPAAVETLSREELFELVGPFFRAVGIAIAIQAIGSLYVYLASHRIVAADLSGRPISGPIARREAGVRFVPGLVAALIVFVSIGLLFGLGLAVWLIPYFMVGTPTAASALVALVLLFAVAAPAVFLSVSFSMVTSVIAIEDRGPVSSLRRSFKLVRTRWWPTLGYLLLVGLLGSVAAQLIQVLAIPLSVVADAASGLAFASILGVVFQGLLIAAIGAMYTVWYVDLRARIEELSAEDLRTGETTA